MRQKQVLVVDDEPSIREIISALLEDEGYEVRSARDGLEALAMLESRTFDLILSDLKMPRLDGFALARRIQQDGHDCPIVLMSAGKGQQTVTGVPFVRKPFEANRLLGIVASTIRTYQRNGAKTLHGAGNFEPEVSSGSPVSEIDANSR